ncbi:MAG: hypothetical protein JXA03_08595 [Bacteroidales bacterium]|nr:hypothetical protein [Bacteroidales bacterium]
MPAIVSKNIPGKAIVNLAGFTEVILFETRGIVYDAIACHPDVFFCQAGEKMIYSPLLPQIIINRLTSLDIPLLEGQSGPGKKYPETAAFNAVCTGDALIHNLMATDGRILSEAHHLQQIHVEQGYCRCNLLFTDQRSYITSDRGIHLKLEREGFSGLYVDPRGILLPGFGHGFFGGACGISGDTVYFTGSLGQYPEGKKAASFLESHGLKIVELCTGPLFDGGGILFV